MADEPQVVSVSSSTQVSPEEIAHKSFPRHGGEWTAKPLAAFLAKVAAELRDTLAREETLRERVAEAERRVADPELDEATLTRAIGVETAKILSTAHEAARNVVALAEQRRDRAHRRVGTGPFRKGGDRAGGSPFDPNRSRAGSRRVRHASAGRSRCLDRRGPLRRSGAARCDQGRVSSHGRRSS